MANTEILEGIRCPVCYEEGRFALQMTKNVLMCDSGLDSMASQPELDHFAGRVIDEDEGLRDEDPISCANRNGCNYYGTVAEFRVENQDKERETSWRREMQLQTI
jgi:hypothetical protein